MEKNDVACTSFFPMWLPLPQSLKNISWSAKKAHATFLFRFYLYSLHFILFLYYFPFPLFYVKNLWSGLINRVESIGCGDYGVSNRKGVDFVGIKG